MSTASHRPLALVTGASAGLGREFCAQLAERGYDLVVVARDEARLDELAHGVSATHGATVQVMRADLTVGADLDRVAERLVRGDVQLLVNNAGFGTTGSLARALIESQEAMLRLHVLAPNRLTQAVLPSMLARSNGAIINVSSVASFVTTAGSVNYCASKAYLRVSSEALAQEVGERGVYVQALCPGFTHTEFHARGSMDKGRIPSYLWLKAERVVRESLDATIRGRPTVVIPGKRYRSIVFALRHAPRWMRVRGARRYRRA
jgi:short-subunit dehydrogenase